MTGTDSLNVERLKDADPQGPREAMDILERAARTARDAGPVRDGGAPAPHAPTALIYRPARNPNQAVRARRGWMLELVPETAQRPEPLMGWTSSSDMRSQVRLDFDTQDEAVAYAKRQGLPYQVVEPQEAKRYAKSYADNFSADRKQPWSH